MVTVAHVYIYTFLHPLMWVFFCSKCVKWVPFSILEDYTRPDVVALRSHNIYEIIGLKPLANI